MSYELEFDPRALKEWKKLGENIKLQFKKKLAEILINPEIPANKLADFPNCYKVKLRNAGYRLVYQVQNDRIVVLVLAVGKQERFDAYRKAKDRL